MEGFGSPTRTLSEEEEETHQSVVETFDHSEMLHIKDIFEGEPKDFARYYGGNPTSAGNKREVAKELVREHSERVKGLLYELDNATVKKNEFEKNLVAEGIPEQLVEELKPTKRRLMVFAYHLLYNERDFDSKLRLLLLNSRLFKETTERTYKYDRDRFDLENFEGEVKRHVRRRNDELYRPFTIRYHESNDTIFLDFYKETGRVMTNIFKQRVEDSDTTNVADPTVTHEPAYTIKTLLCRVDTSSKDEVKFVFKTDPKSRWRREVKRFFDLVAGIENPFDESNQEVDEGASKVHDTALETAAEKDENEFSVKDVEQAVTEAMQDLAYESNHDLPDISGEDIKWVGWTVDDDDDTMTDIDDFTAKTDIQNYVEDTPGAGDRLFHILNEAEEGNIGLRFRSDFGEGNNETFIVRSKFWIEDAQVDETARSVLNAIFKGEGDAD